MDVRINLKVIANSKSNRVDKFLLEDGEYKMTVRTSQIAENGKANDKVIQLIADFFAVNKSSIHIMFGTKNKNKVVLVQKVKELPYIGM
jgi:uncharacterized protein YggU (UPF0235/DUF167 family)